MYHPSPHEQRTAAQACATLQLMACTFRGDFEFFAVPALPVAGSPFMAAVEPKAVVFF
jgi:hypothetical protein